MGSKPKKKNGSKSSRPQGSCETPIKLSLNLFRGIGEKILVEAKVDRDDEDWDQKVNELAVQLMGKCELLVKHYKGMDKLIGEGKASISWSVTVDRTVIPPSVEVKGSFGEKTKMKFKSDIPDPNAQDLPGLSREEVEAQQQQQQDPGDGSGDGDPGDGQGKE